KKTSETIFPAASFLRTGTDKHCPFLSRGNKICAFFPQYFFQRMGSNSTAPPIHAYASRLPYTDLRGLRSHDLSRCMEGNPSSQSRTSISGSCIRSIKCLWYGIYRRRLAEGKGGKTSKKPRYACRMPFLRNKPSYA